MNDNISTPENSPIDFSSALERIGNDKSFLQELLKLYEMDFDAKFEGLQNAIYQEDFSSIQELGHSLKGSSANLSLPYLQRAALDMECAGRERDLPKAQGALDTLGREFQKLQQFLTANSG